MSGLGILAILIAIAFGHHGYYRRRYDRPHSHLFLTIIVMIVFYALAMHMMQSARFPMPQAR
jgi:hypothetical protein